MKYNTLACAKGMRWATEEEASDLFLHFSTGEGPHIWQKMGACHRPSESLDKDFLTTADCSAGCVRSRNKEQAVQAWQWNDKAFLAW